MSLKRYSGMLMYAAYLPFSIYAPDETTALAELRKQAPASLSGAEQAELLFHLERTAKADKVTAVEPESSGNGNGHEPKNPTRASGTFRVKKQVSKEGSKSWKNASS
jgi:hypothetical protein